MTVFAKSKAVRNFLTIYFFVNLLEIICFPTLGLARRKSNRIGEAKAGIGMQNTFTVMIITLHGSRVE